MPQAPGGTRRLLPPWGAAAWPAPLRFPCQRGPSLLTIAPPTCTAHLAALQGVQDKVLEAQLPNVEVTERALAINALLSALKLQVGSRASWTASVALHCLSQQHETRQGWLAPPARPCCSSHLSPCLLACLARLCRAAPCLCAPACADPCQPRRPQQPHLQGQCPGGHRTVRAPNAAAGAEPRLLMAAGELLEWLLRCPTHLSVPLPPFCACVQVQGADC